MARLVSNNAYGGLQNNLSLVVETSHPFYSAEADTIRNNYQSLTPPFLYS
ncbi:MAG: hypothetical protein U5L96_08465 [Owenweeksia sp.]|nr:hypothetical protein [Owenweeksia sp.]